jgi:hypothetical protein
MARRDNADSRDFRQRRDDLRTNFYPPNFRERGIMRIASKFAGVREAEAAFSTWWVLLQLRRKRSDAWCGHRLNTPVRWIHVETDNATGFGRPGRGDARDPPKENARRTRQAFFRGDYLTGTSLEQIQITCQLSDEQWNQCRTDECRYRRVRDRSSGIVRGPLPDSGATRRASG